MTGRSDRQREKLRLAAGADEGKPLPAFAWPGGYPLFYVNNEGACLCADCAEEADSGAVAVDVHWEGEPIICDACNKEIESAYGVPDED